MKSYTVIRKIICLMCLLTVFSLSFNALSQESQEMSDAAQAIIDAKKDVEAPSAWLATNFLMSSVLGCLGGTAIVVSSQFFEPSPPTHRFVGKSAEYVSFYTQAYQDVTKEKRYVYASIGCVGGTIISTAFWAIVYIETL